MNLRLALHPDLTECTLEPRCVMSYTPDMPAVMLTATDGFVMPAVPPNLSAAAYAMPYQVSSALYPTTTPNASMLDTDIGGDGGDVATIFRPTGFGLSDILVGNNFGFPLLHVLHHGPNPSAAVTGGTAASASSATTGIGGAGTIMSLQADGSAFSSGFNYAVNSSNNYGMTNYGMNLQQIGSVPIHRFADQNDADDLAPPLPPDDPNVPHNVSPPQRNKDPHRPPPAHRKPLNEILSVPKPGGKAAEKNAPAAQPEAARPAQVQP
jgi:hypothetical protein